MSNETIRIYSGKRIDDDDGWCDDEFETKLKFGVVNCRSAQKKGRNHN